jgi:hypothetical protein
MKPSVNAEERKSDPQKEIEQNVLKEMIAEVPFKTYPSKIDCGMEEI